MQLNAGRTYQLEKRRLLREFSAECQELKDARGVWETLGEALDVWHLFIYIVMHRGLGSHVYNPMTLVWIFWAGGLWIPIKHGTRYWQYRCIRSLRHHELGHYDHECMYGR